ncbi:MAG: NAD(P)-dependent oxidoreductase [Alphaproteobacteria bacterium]|nr:NAD(P)-dependent oxidoreductase [Alphaproteobacteria bacterium]
MERKKKRVLVCGATGFIGRNTVERLARRDDLEVVAVHNRRPPFALDGVRWVKADLTRAEDVNRVVEGMDAIVHAAATTSGAKDILTRPYIHVTDNAVMTSLLFRAAYEYSVPQLFFFSCTIMYQSGETPVKETDFDPSDDLYPNYFGAGWTKIYLEKMCEFYARFGRTSFTIARHSNIYGAYDKYDLERSHVFGATVTKVMTAKDGRIVVWGAGEESRDLLHVDDLVDFVELALDRQKAPVGLYNVGAGTVVAIKDLVAKIVAISGRDLAIEHDLSKPSIKTSLCLDCGRAKQDLGWAPRIGLDEGIARTIAWWRENVTPAA